MAKAKKVEEIEKITFSRFDAAEYLKSETDMVLFLKAAMEEEADEPAYIAEAIGTIARARHDSAREGSGSDSRGPLPVTVQGRQTVVRDYLEGHSCARYEVDCRGGLIHSKSALHCFTGSA